MDKTLGNKKTQKTIQMSLRLPILAEVKMCKFVSENFQQRKFGVPWYYAQDHFWILTSMFQVQLYLVVDRGIVLMVLGLEASQTRALWGYVSFH